MSSGNPSSECTAVKSEFEQAFFPQCKLNVQVAEWEAAIQLCGATTLSSPLHHQHTSTYCVAHISQKFLAVVDAAVFSWALNAE
jgi:hypothetical protein